MSSMPIDEPTADNISLLRSRAGLTQTQAAAMVGLEGFQQWSKWERGLETMPQALWELFLVKCGSHPHYMPRPGVELPLAVKAQVQAERMAQLKGKLQRAERGLFKPAEASRKRPGRPRGRPNEEGQTKTAAEVFKLLAKTKVARQRFTDMAALVNETMSTLGLTAPMRFSMPPSGLPRATLVNLGGTADSLREAKSTFSSTYCDMFGIDVSHRRGTRADPSSSDQVRMIVYVVAEATGVNPKMMESGDAWTRKAHAQNATKTLERLLLSLEVRLMPLPRRVQSRTADAARSGIGADRTARRQLVAIEPSSPSYLSTAAYRGPRLRFVRAPSGSRR